MPQTHQEAIRYNTAIQQLLDSYCAFFPEDVSRLAVLLQQVRALDSELCNRRTLPGHLTGAALVLRSVANQDCALLIRHNSLNRWLQPGGHLDPGEHPLEGARRELLEEAGLQAALHPWHARQAIPLDIDSHVIPANAAKQEPQHLHHDWMYVFIAGACDVILQQDEVSNFSWVPLADMATGGFGSRLQRAAEKLSRLQLCVDLKRQ